MGKFVHSAASVSAVIAMMLSAAQATPGPIFSSTAGSSIGEEAKAEKSKPRAFLSFVIGAGTNSAADHDDATCPEESKKRLAKADKDESEEEPSLAAPEPIYFAF
ncbi:hypothetical protein [Hyphococcus sp. DH-69]|uniref:hypothetical protein n=1 Tax=Hyphococcus formosus TaxID=3143534 RepID=UPI00398A5580